MNTENRTAIDAHALNWKDIETQLDAEGWVVLHGLLDGPQCTELVNAIEHDNAASTRVGLDRAELGQGDQFYFSPPLPVPLSYWQATLYEALVPIANRWAETRDLMQRYPACLAEYQAQHRNAGHEPGRPSLLRLRENDYLALHVGAQTEEDFPLQLVGLLSRPGQDFTGGEFVMTEQRPRIQSRPMVLPWHQGDIAIIASGQRPFRGTRGYYSVTLRHAVSRVRSGERVGLDLRFHDDT